MPDYDRTAVVSPRPRICGQHFDEAVAAFTRGRTLALLAVAKAEFDDSRHRLKPARRLAGVYCDRAAGATALRDLAEEFARDWTPDELYLKGPSVAHEFSTRSVIIDATVVDDTGTDELFVVTCPALDDDEDFYRHLGAVAALCGTRRAAAALRLALHRDVTACLPGPRFYFDEAPALGLETYTAVLRADLATGTLAENSLEYL